jgi:hypothetical protein
MAHQEVYLLAFSPLAPGDEAAPPYEIRIETPDGRALWQGIREAGIETETPLEFVLPVRGLRPGRHAVVVRDARGIVRTYPFIVPGIRSAR